MNNNQKKELAYSLYKENNIEKAYNLYKELADSGDIESSLFYATYCLENNNHKEGEAYMQIAIDDNNIDAIYDTATYLMDGSFGYKEDKSKAMDLFYQAASLGDIPAYAQIYTHKKNTLGSKKAWQYIREEFGFPPLFKMIKYCFSKKFN